jgi:TM2 domain-containing membrane protein YozV
MSAIPNAKQPAANPLVATLLTWFVPGAGHLYMGRMGRAILAFLLVEGTFALGFILSDGRIWEFLSPELRGGYATLLSPDVGNLGGWLAIKELRGFGPPYPRPWPELVNLGSMLIALSGILNICFMVCAHLDARVGRDQKIAGLPPSVAVFFAWLVPGLGHLLQGRRLRALIVAALLIGLFGLGTFFAEASNLSRERHFYYWGGQFFLGLPALATEIFSGRPPVTHVIPRVDVGLLFASMAGLLNVLAMLDVYAWGEDVVLGNDPIEARRKKQAEAKV